jgi:hypothetical protein
MITAMFALSGITRRRLPAGLGGAAGFAATLFSAGGFGLILIIAFDFGARRHRQQHVCGIVE